PIASDAEWPLPDTRRKAAWPTLPVVLTSGQTCERARQLPRGVAYVPKPWQPLHVLVIAQQALAYAQGHQEGSEVRPHLAGIPRMTAELQWMVATFWVPGKPSIEVPAALGVPGPSEWCLKV